ncbi:MAG: XdhC family protein [Gammaproteobacteria bacterium]|nr:XdhC family protein [Gammaproteobacteria bacterium]
MKWSLFERLAAARAAKRPVALLTALASGEQVLRFEDDNDDGAFGAETSAAAREALASGESRTIESDVAGKIFIHVFNPPLRLFVVGAVHITQALAPMAAMLGYAVTVVDPRRAFASPQRFAEVRVLDAWPDDALAEEALDARSAVVTLTHDPKLDDPALAAALASDAFYIGCLGSRRTHAKRLERLARAGFDASQFKRLHGPVGLAIGARTPAEIATAILAEMTQTLRQGGSR